jgi:hypothetical protein
LNHRGSDLPTRVRPQRQAKQEAKVRLEKADKSSSGSSSSSSSGGGSSSGSEEESELESEEPTVSEVRQSSELPTTKSTEDSKSEAERVEEVMARNGSALRRGLRSPYTVNITQTTSETRRLPVSLPRHLRLRNPKLRNPKLRNPRLRNPKLRNPRLRNPRLRNLNLMKMELKV